MGNYDVFVLEVVPMVRECTVHNLPTERKIFLKKYVEKNAKSVLPR